MAYRYLHCKSGISSKILITIKRYPIDPIDKFNRFGKLIEKSVKSKKIKGKQRTVTNVPIRQGD